MEALAFQQEYSFIASSVYDYNLYKGSSQKINLNGHSFTVQYNGAKLFVDGLPGGPIKLEPGKDVILAFKGSTVAVLFSNSLKETAQKLQSLESNGWEVYRMYTDGIYRSERGSYAGFHIERITADFSKWTEESIIRATYQETLTFRLEDGKDLSIITVYNNGKPYYFMNGEITNGKVEPYFDIGAKIKTRDGRIIPLHQALREISLNPNLIQDYAYKRQVFHPGSNDHMKTQKFWDPNRTNVIFHKPSQNSSTDVRANLHEPVRQDSKDVPASSIPNQPEELSNSQNLKDVPTKHEPVRQDSKDVPANNITSSTLNQTQESETSPNQESKVNEPDSNTKELGNANKTTSPSQLKSSSSDVRKFLPDGGLDESDKKFDDSSTMTQPSLAEQPSAKIPAQTSEENSGGVRENTTIPASPGQKEEAYQAYILEERIQYDKPISTQSESLAEQTNVKERNSKDNSVPSSLNQNTDQRLDTIQESQKLEQSVTAEQQKQPETLKDNNFSFGVQSNLLNGNMSNNLTNSNVSSFGVRNSLLNQNLTGSMDQTQQSETSSDVDQSNQNSSNSLASSTLNQSVNVNGLSVERSAVEQTFTLNLGELNGVNVALTVERYSDGSYMIQYGDSSVKIDGNREVIVYVQDGKLKLQEANPQLKSDLSRKGITFYTIKKAAQQEPIQDWASKSVYTLTTENGQQIKVVHYITQSGESRYFIEEQGKLIEYNPTTDQERIMVIDSTGKLVELSKAVPERFISVKRINDDLYVEFDSNTKRNYDALSELKLNDYEKSLLGSILPHLSPDEIRSAITELETQGQELSFYHLYKILYQKAIESNAKERSYRSPAI
jgi:hypothetical protein